RIPDIFPIHVQSCTMRYNDYTLDARPIVYVSMHSIKHLIDVFPILLSHLIMFMSAVMTAPYGSLKLVSKVGCRVANHGPIGDFWPIAFLGHARGHRVILETRCRSTQIA